MSWYLFVLGALDDGGPNPQAKHHRPGGLTEALVTFDSAGSWNGQSNSALANYRLTTAICPAQVPVFVAGTPTPASYVALGGIGLGTPGLKLDEAGKDAGAYRFDGPTPDKAFIDGLRQTAQIIETNRDLGPWLQGGSSTLRGLDPSALPYLGIDRPFGGCHPGGAYASMADGSVRFLKDTIDPAIFRAILTLAGGPGEQEFDAP
jgi:prepilin-type processing-associated H-X9-DG protein